VKLRGDVVGSDRSTRHVVEGLPVARDAGTGAVELAAWTSTVRVLVNLDEFLTRE